jgi:hypothetical protein
MIDAAAVAELEKTLDQRTDLELSFLFAANAFACAVYGGKTLDTPWARLHRAILAELHRRGLNGRQT